MAKLNLNKNETKKLNLVKNGVELKNLRVEFFWKSQGKLDLDASIFICRLNAEGKPIIHNSEQIAFYNQKITSDRSVKLGADVQDGTEDLETAEIYTDLVDKDHDAIAFVLTIDDKTPNKVKTFGNADSGKFTLFNADNNEIILEYDFVGEDTASWNVLHVGTLVKDNGKWAMENYGEGLYTQDGIMEAMKLFGAPNSWF